MTDRYGLQVLAFFTCIIFSNPVGAGTRAEFRSLGMQQGMSSACCVSDDGAAVAGDTIGTFTTNFQAFRWTELEGLQGLVWVESYGSFSNLISGDGRVVIGNVLYGDFAGPIFLWTAETGFQEIGTSYNFPTMKASAISHDGTVVVGTGTVNPNDSQAFRWTASTGFIGLGFLPGGSWSASTANAVSDDGAVVVGGSSSFLTSQYEAFRWTEAEGMVGLGLLEGGGSSNATHISDDGLVIAGNATTSFIENNNRAFRWTAESGMVGLGLLPEAETSFLLDLSKDGKVTVGFSGNEAFRWTESTGMVGLGRLPGDSATKATMVSSDGGVIIGYSSYGEAREYFVWMASTGIQKLRDVLAADFIDVSAWTDFKALDLSDDGSTVVGVGTNPEGNSEAWVVRLPSEALIADAGGPYSGARNQLIIFDGRQHADNGTYTYFWDFGDGSTGSGPVPTHAYSTSGNYTVTLIVSDGVKESPPSTASVVVTNNAPVARISGPTRAYKNSPLTWDGSLSSDKNSDPLTYSWNFGDGATANTNIANHVFNAVGNYTVSLVVHDGETSSTPTEMTVSIESKPPIAEAGLDQNVKQRSNVTLNGSASTDSDGVIAKVQWTQISGPTVSLSGSDALTANFVAPKTNQSINLVFKLIVTDDDGLQSSDQVVVIVAR